jgi:hypothetical protein
MQSPLDKRTTPAPDFGDHLYWPKNREMNGVSPMSHRKIAGYGFGCLVVVMERCVGNPIRSVQILEAPVQSVALYLKWLAHTKINISVSGGRYGQLAL